MSGFSPDCEDCRAPAVVFHPGALDPPAANHAWCVVCAVRAGWPWLPLAKRKEAYGRLSARDR